MAAPAVGVAAVVGAGPGLGFAVARRFARDNYKVALLSRTEEKLQKLASEINQEGKGQAIAVPVDATDPKSIKAAVAAVKSRLGPIDVLVYNANAPFPGWGPTRPKFHELPPDIFEGALRSQPIGAFYFAQEVLPDMVANGRGTLLFTGATASLRGSAGFATLAVPKFALRALTQCLAREYHPQGIHVAHVIIDGVILTPKTKEWAKDRPEDSFLHPDAIAETYWQLHVQDKTTWAQEIDLRPYGEKF